METPQAVLDWRQASATDEPFLLDLTYRTMEKYLAAYQLSGEEDMRAWLKSRNAKFRWFVGSLEGTSVGALAYSRLPDRINIDSIHILPEYQNRGLGTEAVRRIQQWALVQKLPVVLQVMKDNNDAKRLYEKLGFSLFHEDERNYHLWCLQYRALDPPVPLNHIGRIEVGDTHYGVVLRDNIPRNGLSHEKRPVDVTPTEEKARKKWFTRLFHRNEA